MKEVKFRVWSNQLNKMVYPDEKGWFRSCFIGGNGITQHCQLGNALDMNGKELEVMQYIGLNANGIDIYENDIIADHVGFGVVEYRDGAYRVNYKDGYCKWFLDYLDSEKGSIDVIGNINENPKLVE